MSSISFQQYVQNYVKAKKDETEIYIEPEDKDETGNLILSPSDLTYFTNYQTDNLDIKLYYYLDDDVKQFITVLQSIPDPVESEEYLIITFLTIISKQYAMNPGPENLKMLIFLVRDFLEFSNICDLKIDNVRFSFDPDLELITPLIDLCNGDDAATSNAILKFAGGVVNNDTTKTFFSELSASVELLITSNRDILDYALRDPNLRRISEDDENMTNEEKLSQIIKVSLLEQDKDAKNVNQYKNAIKRTDSRLKRSYNPFSRGKESKFYPVNVEQQLEQPEKRSFFGFGGNKTMRKKYRSTKHKIKHSISTRKNKKVDKNNRNKTSKKQ